ncbi:MAG: heme-binding beta-barrel domain-containing protein, partial [Bermanella sp.]
MNSIIDNIDYGPLAALVGSWQGAAGIDTSPLPNGQEDTPYHETIVYEAIGHAKNAGSQTLAVVRYLQRVCRQSDGEVFHDQSGYWIWDNDRHTLIHSFSIPRGVCVLAGGKFDHSQLSGDALDLTVSAAKGHKDWSIIQSPFMQQKARTVGFDQQVTISAHELSYRQTIMLEIYGREFEHTDSNTLRRGD